MDFCFWSPYGRVVINIGCRTPAPAYSRLFQLRSEEGLDYKERVQWPVPCALCVHWDEENRLDDRENTVFCAQILLCALDGWERQSNEINRLEVAVCATCAVRDCMLREVEGKSNEKVGGLNEGCARYISSSSDKSLRFATSLAIVVLSNCRHSVSMSVWRKRTIRFTWLLPFSTASGSKTFRSVVSFLCHA